MLGFHLSPPESLAAVKVKPGMVLHSGTGSPRSSWKLALK